MSCHGPWGGFCSGLGLLIARRGWCIAIPHTLTYNHWNVSRMTGAAHYATERWANAEDCSHVLARQHRWSPSQTTVTLLGVGSCFQQEEKALSRLTWTLLNTVCFCCWVGSGIPNSRFSDPLTWLAHVDVECVMWGVSTRHCMIINRRDEMHSIDALSYGSEEWVHSCWLHHCCFFLYPIILMHLPLDPPLDPPITFNYYVISIIDYPLQ